MSSALTRTVWRVRPTDFTFPGVLFSAPIQRVEFLVNGEKIGEDTDATDGWVMDWRDIPSGLVGSIVKIAVRAIDDDDAAGTGLSYVHIQPRPPTRR